MSDHILVIDEGTTSTRAIVFDRDFQQVALAQQEVPLAYPADGWVEQDAEQIWQATHGVCQRAIAEIGGVSKIAGIGITNQRETTLIWDRAASKAIGPAIIWQDRRTEPHCLRLRETGATARVSDVTGLVIDPYFSATKIAWLVAHYELDPADIAAGRYAFGTVDSWLIWKLTGGRAHLIDQTNASRTLLMDLQTGRWDAEMLDLFGVPAALLPEIVPSSGRLATAESGIFGAPLPILSAIGDQQAALVGQGCLSPGNAKITLGTGAFLVANTGIARAHSTHALLSTVGYNIGGHTAALALEGAIFNAGTVVQWLRDDLGLIGQAADTEAMARSVVSSGGAYFVPAFTGLGAPHWAADARGEITGLTRATTAAHIVRAGLEACAYQTRDLLDAFAADGAPVETLCVDGGMAANDWLMQFMADICEVPIHRPDYMEMTALGAGALAAIALGWETPESWAGRGREAADQFMPEMDAATRASALNGWQRAVSKATAPT